MPAPTDWSFSPHPTATVQSTATAAEPSNSRRKQWADPTWAGKSSSATRTALQSSCLPRRDATARCSFVLQAWGCPCHVPSQKGYFWHFRSLFVPVGLWVFQSLVSRNYLPFFSCLLAFCLLVMCYFFTDIHSYLVPYWWEGIGWNEGGHISECPSL